MENLFSINIMKKLIYEYTITRYFAETATGYFLTSSEKNAKISPQKRKSTENPVNVREKFKRSL